MRKRLYLIVLLLLLSPAASKAWADSWAPFCNFRKPDATGRYYIVVKKAEGAPKDPGRGTPIIFEIGERRAGTPPVTEARDQEEIDRVIPNPEVRVLDDDTVLGRGKLERCPLYTLVSSTGLGFVGLDVRGYNHGKRRSGDAVVIVNSKGEVRHRKDLVDLFTEGEIYRFLETAGGVWWLGVGGGWIDEQRREVVVVSSNYGRDRKPLPRLFCIVGLEKGNVRRGSEKDVITALAEENRGALDFALELTAELKLKNGLEHLPKLFENKTLPLATRLRAAVALATLGDARGGDLMTKAALEKSEDQSYAVQNLPIVLGDKAAPVLCQAVKRHGKRCQLVAWQAMSLVSSKAAVPELIPLLEAKESYTCRTFAAECLGNQGAAAKSAVPNLIKILQVEDQTDGLLSTHQYAAIALGRIGPDAKDALPHLIRLAEIHAKDEWEHVKAKQPKLRSDHFGGEQYSDDYFIDAICKIRQK
jgi:HEAT repeat protein